MNINNKLIYLSTIIINLKLKEQNYELSCSPKIIEAIKNLYSSNVFNGLQGVADEAVSRHNFTVNWRKWYHTNFLNRRTSLQDHTSTDCVLIQSNLRSHKNLELASPEYTKKLSFPDFFLFFHVRIQRSNTNNPSKPVYGNVVIMDNFCFFQFSLKI